MFFHLVGKTHQSRRPSSSCQLKRTSRTDTHTRIFSIGVNQKLLLIEWRHFTRLIATGDDDCEYQPCVPPTFGCPLYFTVFTFAREGIRFSADVAWACEFKYILNLLIHFHCNTLTKLRWRWRWHKLWNGACVYRQMNGKNKSTPNRNGHMLNAQNRMKCVDDAVAER